MRKLQLYFIFAIFFVLAGCSCRCTDVDTTIASTTQKTTSTLYVFADGCSNSDGQVDSGGYPQGVCDVTNGHLKRGKWVQSPKIDVAEGRILHTKIDESIYFCSTGYDNQNPFSKFTVTPGTAKSTYFANGSQLSVEPGDMIVVETENDNIGVTVGANTSSVNSACASYTALTLGQCRGQLGFGLTIYVGDTEIVTLDEMNQLSSLYIPYAEFRKSYYFDAIPANERTEFFTDVNSGHKVDFTSYGQGKYVFMVPETVQAGVLGFAIAQGTGTAGSGSYTMNIKTTPSPCYVNQAEASTTPGKRGGLLLLISNSNPNDIDNVIDNFNSLNNGTEISVYYPQLLKYISSKSNVTISSNAQVLSAIVTTTSPQIKPITITSSSYKGIMDKSGNIWYKVLDDYYSDNVGAYYVTTNVV
ncbi:MAG: hypothetical protein AABY27_00535, partial [Pseudomonadota bacterium]